MFSQKSLTIGRPVLTKCCKGEYWQLKRKLQLCTTNLYKGNLFKIPESSRYQEFLMKRSNDFTLQRQIGSGSILKGSVKEADYEEIRNLPKHPEKLLIDVREPSELDKTGKIPTSINIPLDDVEKELSQSVAPLDFEHKYGRKKPDKNSEIIFSCMSGKRASKAAGYAVALGYKNVKVYDGSWLNWSENEDSKT